MGSSEYVYDLGSIQWCYRANICSQPAFHPAKERQKKKPNSISDTAVTSSFTNTGFF